MKQSKRAVFILLSFCFLAFKLYSQSGNNYTEKLDKVEYYEFNASGDSTLISTFYYSYDADGYLIAIQSFSTKLDSFFYDQNHHLDSTASYSYFGNVSNINLDEVIKCKFNQLGNMYDSTYTDYYFDHYITKNSITYYDSVSSRKDSTLTSFYNSQSQFYQVAEKIEFEYDSLGLLLSKVKSPFDTIGTIETTVYSYYPDSRLKDFVNRTYNQLTSTWTNILKMEYFYENIPSVSYSETRLRYNWSDSINDWRLSQHITTTFEINSDKILFSRDTTWNMLTGNVWAWTNAHFNDYIYDQNENLEMIYSTLYTSDNDTIYFYNAAEYDLGVNMDEVMCPEINFGEANNKILRSFAARLYETIGQFKKSFEKKFYYSPILQNNHQSVDKDVTLYPNPADKEIIIRHPDMIDFIEVYTIYGDFLYSTDCEGTETKLNVQDLPVGTYILKTRKGQHSASSIFEIIR